MQDIQREIDKQPLAPSLPAEAIRLINELLFDKPDSLTEPCEATLIFGTSTVPNYVRLRHHFRFVQELVRSSVVYITGGVTMPGQLSESEHIHTAIGAMGYKDVQFKLDFESKDTKNNVIQAVRLGLGSHRNIMFIAKTQHCGRCKLTLMKHLPPNVTIRHRGYEPTVVPDGPRMDPMTWQSSPKLSSLVWGEFLRIEKYGLRGDIAYPSEVADKVRRVREIVH